MLEDRFLLGIGLPNPYLTIVEAAELVLITHLVSPCRRNFHLPLVPVKDVVPQYRRGSLDDLQSEFAPGEGSGFRTDVRNGVIFVRIKTITSPTNSHKLQESPAN